METKTLPVSAIEAGAKAMFEVDWPKDKKGWDKLGPGYHQDRYIAMMRVGIAAWAKAMGINHD